MQSWHYYLIITLVFFLNNTLHTLFGIPSALLLGVTTFILVQPQNSAMLKIYAIALVCFDYFVWLDQLGPPLLYLAPLYLLAPALNQLLMPRARSLLPYAFFSSAYLVQIYTLEPLTTGVLPPFACTIWPFCAIVLGIYSFEIYRSTAV